MSKADENTRGKVQNVCSDLVSVKTGNKYKIGAK